MIELVNTIKQQADDNPQMTEKILGKAVVEEAKKIYNQLNK